MYYVNLIYPSMRRYGPHRDDTIVTVNEVISVTGRPLVTLPHNAGRNPLPSSDSA